MYLACNKKRSPFVLSSVASYFLLPLHASLSLFFHLFLFSVSLSVSPSLPLSLSPSLPLSLSPSLPLSLSPSLPLSLSPSLPLSLSPSLPLSLFPSLPLPYKASFFSLYIPVTVFPLPVFPVVRAYVRAYVHACVRKHLIYNNNGFSDRA